MPQVRSPLDPQSGPPHHHGTSAVPMSRLRDEQIARVVIKRSSPRYLYCGSGCLTLPFAVRQKVIPVVDTRAPIAVWRSVRSMPEFSRLLLVRLVSQFGDGLFQAGLAGAILFNP